MEPSLRLASAATSAGSEAVAPLSRFAICWICVARALVSVTWAGTMASRATSASRASKTAAWSDGRTGGKNSSPRWAGRRRAAEAPASLHAAEAALRGAQASAKQSVPPGARAVSHQLRRLEPRHAAGQRGRRARAARRAERRVGRRARELELLGRRVVPRDPPARLPPGPGARARSASR